MLYIFVEKSDDHDRIKFTNEEIFQRQRDI